MAVGLYSGVSGLAVGVGLYQGVSGLWGGASGLINGFGGSGPFPGSSLYLDFLTPPLDSRITFSRGTNATLVDSTGKITYAPANLLTFSEQFDNAAWTKTATTVTANATTAPDGTSTADKIVETATTGNHLVRSGTGVPLNGVNTISVYAKAAERSAVVISLIGSPFNAAYFDLSGVQARVLNGGTNATIQNVGDGWYRCSYQTVSLTSYTNDIYVAMTDDYSRDAIGYTGNGTSGLFLWGAQLEPVTYQTTPGPYVATTASAYYGPRFDYDPVTLAPRGLLIEEARTNLLLYSEQFDNAYWVKANATVTANVTASPDGTTNADLFASTGGETRIGLTSGIVVANTTYTASIFGKIGNANGRYLWFREFFSSRDAAFDLQTGTVTQVSANMTASVVVFANGWFRCLATWTAPAAPVVVNQQYWVQSPSGTNPSLGAAGGQSYLYGAQLEAGAFATSYIPTVASTVSRSADVATMTGTNFSTWYNQSEGTFIVGTGLLASFNFPVPFMVADSAAATTKRIQIYLSGTAPTYRVTDGTDQVAINTAAVAIPGVSAFSTAYKLNDFAATVNGATVVTDTSGTVPAVNTLYIGNQASSQFLNGHIRAIAYYNTRLPNTQLQTLTAPSLASPLALDFLSTSYTVGY
jgi:hypothetical protein